MRLPPTSTSAHSLRNQTIAGLTSAVGDTVRVGFSVTGTNPTTLSAKAWKVGTT